MRTVNAALITCALAAVVVGAGAAGNGNLTALHHEAKANAAQCTTCHGDRKGEVAKDGKSKTLHSRHLSSALLKFTCTNCHQCVDLREKSAASVRKQVSSELCAECHSAWPANKMHNEKTQGKCTTCHPDWKETMAKAAPFVALGKVTDKDCYGCHGGRTLFVKEKTHDAKEHAHE